MVGNLLTWWTKNQGTERRGMEEEVDTKLIKSK